MLEECPASCSDEDYPTKTDKACKDHHLRCPVWADLGECAENPTNMKRYCPLSCGICKDPNRDTNDDGDDHLCVDSDAQCEFWVSRGECSANPGFMHTACAKSCGTCVINKRKEEKKKKKAVDAAAAAEVNLTDEEQKLVTLSADFGDIQKITGAEAYNTLALLRQTAAYMQTDVPRLPDDIQDKCLNRNELCSFWAFLGECDKNQAFMLTNCAPSCKSCHLIDMDARCPPLADATPALKPGDLNKMFENIVKDAPGNRTLTNEERKELKDKMTPEYTVTVHSRPSSSPAIEVSSVLDKSLPPWIITFDNFLTPEECQTLIDLGHKAGYERSRDVGKQNFDGSFDGLESTGRTSENAWCSGMKGCRQDEVVQRVMDRMGAVMGIPADNSEDLQILKYEKTQFYNAHHDYIPHQKDRQCGPRILTFFLYLSDVEAGGGTKFHKLGHTIMPKVGRAVLWPSVYDSDPLKDDGRTFHEALPVEAGTKFAANGWFHLYDYVSPQSMGCN